MTIHPEAGATASNQFGDFAVHYATDRQVGFVRSLFNSRNATDAGENLAELNEIYAQVQTGRVSKKAASRAIDLLLALPERVVHRPLADEQPYVVVASDKQISLIEKLERERESTWTPAQVNEAMRTRGGASKYIDALFASPKREIAIGRDIAAGMYVAPDGRIFRAYLGQQSGQILCKEIVEADGLAHDTGTDYALEYRGLAAKHIPADSRRMTLEEAKEWGKATGSCVRCGRRLDVPESVDAGIGPVCAGKGEW